ncbi:MAG TPA: hypothetical protein VNH82_05765 [Candidatus Dormibacteraeota bacterium]|nr:hypothetical protein [Candidatus Dormibacteraeota bacterium]
MVITSSKAKARLPAPVGENRRLPAPFHPGRCPWPTARKVTTTPSGSPLGTELPAASPDFTPGGRVIAAIPQGEVLTYGQVARLAG